MSALTDAERNALDDSLVDTGCHGFQGDHPELYAAVEQIIVTRVAEIRDRVEAAFDPGDLDCIRLGLPCTSVSAPNFWCRPCRIRGALGVVA